MRLRHTQRAAARRHPFTLVELLTVMLIVGILLAVTVPVIVKISSGSSVEAASRMVGAQLRLARQEAIVRRKSIAVLFPTTTNDASDPVAYAGFRPCFAVNDGGTWRFDRWLENVAWTYVPTGAAIVEVDADYPSGSPAVPDMADGVVTTISPPTPLPTPNAFGFAQPVRAVLFKTTGRLSSTQRGVTIVEAGIAPGTATFLTKNARNWINIEINEYTGRVTFTRPEDM